MVAIPTYIYVGDEQITGGPTGINKPETGSPVFWGIARLFPKLNRVVPSGPDGINGGTYSPYWDGRAGSLQTSTGATSTTITVSGTPWTTNQFAGKLVYIDAGVGVGQERTVVSNTSNTITVSVAWTTNPTSSTFHVRTGKFVPFHYMEPNALFPTVDPTSNGDNWFYDGGAITPCSMLMQELAVLHGNATPGFKMLKFGTTGGCGAGLSPMRPGQLSWSLLLGHIADMEAAIAPDTLDIRAVIVDLSTNDLLGVNFNYQTQAQEFITGVRSDIDADALIVLVNQHREILKTAAPGLSNFVRGVNRTLQQTNTGVVLFDMNWGKFAPTTILAPATEPTDPIYYDTETYLQAGIGLFNAIQAYYTEAPASTLGNAIAGLAMFGDSQLVTAGMDPLYAVLSNQASIIGPTGGTFRPGVYVWNNTTEQVEPYDITANASTFGSVLSSFGPESTLLKKAVERYGQVVLFKHAEAGAPLTVEAGLAGNPQGAFEEGTPRWSTTEAQFEKFRIACLRDLGKQVDMVGALVSLGENDLWSTSVVNAFAAKAPVFIDSIRSLVSTRATGDPLPLVWLQGPPPSTLVSGGSSLGQESIRVSYRDAVLSLEGARANVRVLRNAGPSDYELNRSDNVHYAAEAVYQIGYDAFDALAALIDGEGGTATATETPSETAAFTVEDGSGLASSNSYCAVATADDYHERYGNPSAWTALSTAAKQQALCIATRAADERYGVRWTGKRLTSEQALDWPRTGAYGPAGDLLAEDAVPVKLQHWVARAALLHVQGNALIPDTQSEADIKSESKSGAGFTKTVTYQGAKSATTQFPALDKMLVGAGLIADGGAWGWAIA
jgi:hypothetical protein